MLLFKSPFWTASTSGTHPFGLAGLTSGACRDWHYIYQWPAFLFVFTLPLANVRLETRVIYEDSVLVSFALVVAPRASTLRFQHHITSRDEHRLTRVLCVVISFSSAVCLSCELLGFGSVHEGSDQPIP